MVHQTGRLRGSAAIATCLVVENGEVAMTGTSAKLRRIYLGS